MSYSDTLVEINYEENINREKKLYLSGSPGAGYDYGYGALGGIPYIAVYLSKREPEAYNQHYIIIKLAKGAPAGEGYAVAVNGWHNEFGEVMELCNTFATLREARAYVSNKEFYTLIA